MLAQVVGGDVVDVVGPNGTASSCLARAISMAQTVHDHMALTIMTK